MPVSLRTRPGGTPGPNLPVPVSRTQLELNLKSLPDCSTTSTVTTRPGTRTWGQTRSQAQVVHRLGDVLGVLLVHVKPQAVSGESSFLTAVAMTPAACSASHGITLHRDHAIFNPAKTSSSTTSLPVSIGTVMELQVAGSSSKFNLTSNFLRLPASLPEPECPSPLGHDILAQTARGHFHWQWRTAAAHNLKHLEYEHLHFLQVASSDASSGTALHHTLRVSASPVDSESDSLRLGVLSPTYDSDSESDQPEAEAAACSLECRCIGTGSGSLAVTRTRRRSDCLPSIMSAVAVFKLAVSSFSWPGPT